MGRSPGNHFKVEAFSYVLQYGNWFNQLCFLFALICFSITVTLLPCSSWGFVGFVAQSCRQPQTDWSLIHLYDWQHFLLHLSMRARFWHKILSMQQEWKAVCFFFKANIKYVYFYVFNWLHCCSFTHQRGQQADYLSPLSRWSVRKL